MDVSPGTKSSEFKALLLATFLLIANGTQWVDIPWDVMNLFLPLIVGGYIGSRTVVKSIAHKNTETANA